MLFGHRRDAAGFGRALEEFDRWLPSLMKELGEGDLLLLSADHGCDPLTPGTDHTREEVPLLLWSPKMRTGKSLGVRETFADVAASLLDHFQVGSADCSGRSFLS